MSTRFKRAVCAVLVVALLMCAGLALDPLQAMRREHNLSRSPTAGLTPELVLATKMLGWGRGLIIDVIWIRMTQLKRDEKFFELVQLADWACKLAPRFPEVWDIQSWNLAYNVSIHVDHLPDRWGWVSSGIRLLRDQGIPYNPYAPMLYERLAWIYFHKIGEMDDNAHFFYKQKLGMLMHKVLGGEGDEETLRALAAAPRSRREISRHEGVQNLQRACSQYKFDLVGRYREILNRAESVPDQVWELLRQPRFEQAVQKVESFERARWLREEYGLEPAEMLRLREKYGPFDWRCAYPHSIYWATRGIEKLNELEKRTLETYERYGVDWAKRGPWDLEREGWKQEEGLFEFRRVSLKRVIYHSMQSLCLQGRLLFDTKGRLMLAMGSDFRFTRGLLPLYDEILEEHSERFARGTADAYRNFLARAIVELGYAGQAGDVSKTQLAKALFKRMKERYPEEVGNKTFEQYRLAEAKDKALEMRTQEVRRMVRRQLASAFFALACNADEKAVILEQKAKAYTKFWNIQAEDNLRGTVRYDRIKEAVVTDILTGRFRWPDTVLAGFKKMLSQQKGGDVAQKVYKNLQSAEEGLLAPEEVGEKWKKETYGDGVSR